MPSSYVSPDVKSTLTHEEIRRRYQDTSLIIFKEHQLYRVRRRHESERESSTYANFDINRKTMTYASNGNDPVILPKTTTTSATTTDGAALTIARTNRESRLSLQLFRIHRKPGDTCTIG
ncbi:uncharacterized protein LOC106650206 [Trichogramma pretiosum]|uniref:uncharacterized protein LOC106650206 n=1 Tax=Trichogramma pretiosum TaxID=7493 RepID=UPI0006C94D45|nr:uncharacterized protein LOC106650206 [Trichogramma pretiosum]